MKQEVKDTGTKDELFTPGEWIMEDFGRSKFEKVLKVAGDKICILDFGYMHTLENAEANAALISQAPAMYRALKKQSELLKKYRAILTGDSTYYKPPYSEKNVHIQELDNELLTVEQLLQKATPNK